MFYNIFLFELSEIFRYFADKKTMANYNLKTETTTHIAGLRVGESASPSQHSRGVLRKYEGEPKYLYVDRVGDSATVYIVNDSFSAEFSGASWNCLIGYWQPVGVAGTPADMQVTAGRVAFVEDENEAKGSKIPVAPYQMGPGYGGTDRLTTTISLIGGAPGDDGDNGGGDDDDPFVRYNYAPSEIYLLGDVAYIVDPRSYSEEFPDAQYLMQYWAGAEQQEYVVLSKFYVNMGHPEGAQAFAFEADSDVKISEFFG